MHPTRQDGWAEVEDGVGSCYFLTKALPATAGLAADRYCQPGTAQVRP